MKQSSSNETQEQALTIAKSTQKEGQTKAQTKLIASGIEKGITEYKKQHKAKARQSDKARKQQVKSKQKIQHDEPEFELEFTESTQMTPMVWALACALGLSWLGFALYFFS
ncbi:DUF2956 domain-containing protein [Shewanella sp. HL-SH5]|uniref:DUF2956 domain-containing protein n=1 Tax=Shewanella sp. HL-SH5 TaxID=3436241 RepID=UPI003EB9846B